MRVLLTRGGNAALLPYLHRPPSARRALTTVAAAAPPQQSRRHHHQLDICESCYRPERFSVRGNGDGRKESVVVVMGATGTGKSKLSIELSTLFAGEVVNADKIQVYRGLDTTTNKMPAAERHGVAHHLLGDLDPAAGELSPSVFREMAARAIAEIAGRGRVPVVAGGSNSFIYAAMAGRYDPGWSPFEAGWRRRMRRREAETLRHRCCFLWVDVDAATLAEQLDRRVDEMLAAGMVEELARYFEEEEAAEAGETRHPGLSKAIGVAEFREYFRGERRGATAAYEAAVAAIKANTRRLAQEQVRKIERLEEMGWPLRRVDATAAVAARLAGSAAEVEAAWERDVAGPGAAAVEQFLDEGIENLRHNRRIVPSSSLLYT
ncbi:adenylate isopentenyltransferase [Canna indica]|uniref:Adenylate isopentenyltransferase n=1 Tax=Canna indica TaxID=4628 RepID=A0AAQ3KYX2_9LILI|nr:adenylate isopentenyltransferase [Canna indica]